MRSPTLDGHCPRCLAEISFAERETDIESFLPRRFGNYELLEEIGRGGMGVVYRARQTGLNREVALKILPGGEFTRLESRRRFQTEARLAAQLRHSRIVAIHEVGEHEGLAFYSMDLVSRRTLADAVREGRWTAKSAARCVHALATAVQYAHERGIVHRDLKPSNVLLDESNEPQVSDFGLARSVADDSSLTLTGQALGTPAYMAPEAASGNLRRSEFPTDLYSLGAILYHLLTGRPPFEGDSAHEIIRQAREMDPVAPSRLNPAIPADLETICLKCLEKEPARRYVSAKEIAEELDRFLRDEPIHARPVSSTERMWRWSRRRPAVATLSVTASLLLVIVVIGSSAAAWRISTARQKAENANLDLLKANTLLADTISLLELQRAEDLFRANEPAAGVAHLAALLRQNPSNSVATSRLVSALVHRNWILPAAPPIRHEQNVRRVLFSPDDHHVLSVSGENYASVRNASNGELAFRLDHDDRVLIARYSPDGRLIASGSADGITLIWNATNGQLATAPLRHDQGVHWAEFTRDGHSVLTATMDKSARIWNTANGQLRHTLAGHDSNVLQAHFSPDGKRIATVAESGAIRLWDADSGRFLFELNEHRTRVNAFSFSPDGGRFVAAGSRGTAWIWNSLDAPSRGIALVHSREIFPIWHATFSPDSQFVLTTSEDTTARVWSATNGFPASQPLTHAGGVVFADFSPDGHTIVTTSTDTSARIWDWRLGRSFVQPLRHGKPVRYAAFSADGQRLQTASTDSTSQLWDLTSRFGLPTEMRHAHDVTSVAFNPRDQSLLTTSLDQTAWVWDARKGQTLGEPMRHEAAVLFGALSQDGRLAVTACANGAAHVWDLATGRIVAGPVRHANAILSARFSPNAERFVTASADGTARVWDARTGQAITPSLAHADDVRTALFSPDERWVVTVSEDRTARVWDSQTGHPVTEPLRHRDHVKWADFSPDGTKVVTASTDDTACIWDVRTSRPVAPLLRHSRIIEMALFSPDGQRIVTVSQDRAARIWDPTTGQALTPPLQHESAVSHVSFSPDGRRILTGGWNGLVRVWDSNTGQPLTEWLFAGGLVTSLCFDSTGQRIATGARGGFARVWDLSDMPTPTPAWFPLFAEAVVGMRLSERGTVELLSRDELDTFARQLERMTVDDFYERLARWFLADPARRPASPFRIPSR